MPNKQQMKLWEKTNFANLKFKKLHILDSSLCMKFELLKENSPRKTSNEVLNKIFSNPKWTN
jgi:hypothetical protein